MLRMSSSNPLNWVIAHESDSDGVEIEAEIDFHGHDQHESEHDDGNGVADDQDENGGIDEESQEYPYAPLAYDQDQQDVDLDEILPQNVEEAGEAEHEPSSLSISMESSFVSATSGESNLSGHFDLIESHANFGNRLSGRSDSSVDQLLSDVDEIGHHLLLGDSHAHLKADD
jgi:hypothetical protein